VDRRLAGLLAGRDRELPTRYEITPVTLDSALRYREAIELIRPLHRPGLRILEVGSGAGGVTDFLRTPVTGVDTTFERTEDRATSSLTRVEARADALPFADGSFDVVLSLEMLEHIPPEQRDAVLSEMLRVLADGGRMVLTFPADEAAARADRALNERFRRRYGSDHPWVIEHITEGVPATEEVVGRLRALVGGGGAVSVRKHDPARPWLLRQTIYSAHWWYRPAVLAGLHSRSGATLLFRLWPRLRSREHYRSIVVVDRSGAAAS
jgi:SAM-dependent methyltransferase